ncbi:interleukin-27 subunit alpha [Spea bombifrons]|uniref:interleukin-27 subunit alpha n=1 Tax=Spea bombifrons TaxID=233779 RepID=UPI00234985F1|nr:interleukin-27 subunit alpha [Spea bombifrons]
MTKLPGTHLDLALADNTFPSLSIGSSDWLRLQAEDRLRLMNEALQVYPGFLEELEKWETQEASLKTNQAGGKQSHFSHKINRARLDLRDLLQHVQFQMSSLGMNVPQPVTPQNLPETGSEWHKRLLMYQALRGMEKTVYRVVREYTALCLATV